MKSNPKAVQAPVSQTQNNRKKILNNQQVLTSSQKN
jgi:hypothetical protein